MYGVKMYEVKIVQFSSTISFLREINTSHFMCLVPVYN